VRGAAILAILIAGCGGKEPGRQRFTDVVQLGAAMISYSVVLPPDWTSELAPSFGTTPLRLLRPEPETESSPGIIVAVSLEEGPTEALATRRVEQLRMNSANGEVTEGESTLAGRRVRTARFQRRERGILIDHVQYYLVDEGHGSTITIGTHPESPAEEQRKIADILQSFRVE